MTDTKKILTDEILESQQKQGVHIRSERICNNTTNIIVCSMWAIAVVLVFSIIYCIYLYVSALNNPTSVSHESVTRIESLTTHIFAVLGGYLAHIMKKSVGE